jgi:hypothetical protein
MKQLTTDRNGKLITVDSSGNLQTIHINHTHETLQDIKEDSFKPFAVAEEVSNFARIHLITAQSEDEALQAIDEYLRENEAQEVEEEGGTHLIGAFELTIKETTPTKGDIITTTDGKKYRVLSVDSNKTLQGLEYSEEDQNSYPRIKMILIKDII